MKISEVPQDRGIVPEGLHEICYAVAENGSYVLADSVGWEPKNVANNQAWEIIETHTAAALEKVRAGEASPLAFHMAVNQMSVGLLAQYVRLNRWRVKRHLNPEVFRRLKPAILRRYADLFGLTPAQLQQVPAGAAPCFRENSLLCK